MSTHPSRILFSVAFVVVYDLFAAVVGMPDGLMAFDAFFLAMGPLVGGFGPNWSPSPPAVWVSAFAGLLSAACGAVFAMPLATIAVLAVWGFLLTLYLVSMFSAVAGRLAGRRTENRAPPRSLSWGDAAAAAEWVYLILAGWAALVLAKHSLDIPLHKIKYPWAVMAVGVITEGLWRRSPPLWALYTGCVAGFLFATAAVAVHGAHMSFLTLGISVAVVVVYFEMLFYDQCASFVGRLTERGIHRFWSNLLLGLFSVATAVATVFMLLRIGVGTGKIVFYAVAIVVLPLCGGLGSRWPPPGWVWPLGGLLGCMMGVIALDQAAPDAVVLAYFAWGMLYGCMCTMCCLSAVDIVRFLCRWQ